ncbi:MAG: hypothetical protein B7C24_09105 [Bacteroidetes bacterium 4572_77]|nr:MAG: hypothetical protein B7C24_09105 [Bacteroidetes bacterium 4572_77]
MDPLNEKHKSLAIYIKSEEIYQTVKEIMALVPEENERLKDFAAMMLNEAMIIQAKIAGAEGGDLYSIRMQNAAIIRKAAMDLIIAKHSFEAFDFKYAEYFDLVRDRIEEFRLLFIDWVASFDQQNYTIDTWGLFNPPGVGPHDKDPDDDIPWEGPNFEDD